MMSREQFEAAMLKAARVTQKLRSELERSEAQQHAPLAIVGVGLRLPGGAHDLASFWSVLAQCADTRCAIPPERFAIDAIYHPDPDHAGTTYVRHASLLDDVAGFDAGLFGITQSEAASMDPQHRLLLEASWCALESAGYAPRALRESSTGVFIGIGPNEYASRCGALVDEGSPYAVTGMPTAFAAGRVAYHFGLQGPALAVDTACSSSLVALRLAAEQLRNRSCDLALVGGVQVLADAAPFALLSATRAIAADGRSKTFSAAADGYGRGEGVVVLAVMRLDDAQREARRILGVVRGIAVTHDGASSGITAPNGASQQKVLRAALRDARLEPEQVEVVECHGTGTVLGDPIELEALDAVYGQHDVRAAPLSIGSVKTNIGHLESASGLAGVAKMLACFAHEALPPTLHSQPRNPHVDWTRLNVEVVDSLRAWPRSAARVRRAAVSSFGISGTNAHVILEEPPQVAAQERAAVALPLVLSASSEIALRAQARRLGAWLAAHPDVPFQDVLASAARRAHLAQRAALCVRSSEEAAEALAALAAAPLPPTPERASTQATQLCMLFTGQGSQRLGMGSELHGSPGFEVFTRAFDEALDACAPHLPRSLREVMASDAQALQQTRYAQPALFALESALYRQWGAWGVQPELLLGHSLGELVAAHVAGVLTLADAAALVCARARLMHERATPHGAMVSLELSAAHTHALLEQLPPAQRGRIEIAALNTPSQTVVAGDGDAIEALLVALAGEGVRARQLEVSHAFHSRHMDGMLAEFRAVAEALSYQRPTLPIVSNLTGKLADLERGELVTADYWVAQVRGAVRFVDAVETAVQRGARLFLECGPDAVLCALAQACDTREVGCFAPSLRGSGSERDAFVRALATLYTRGVDLAFGPILGHDSAHLVELPHYAFQRERFWLDGAPRGTRAEPPLLESAVACEGLPLAGRALALAGGGALHLLPIGPELQPYLRDHVVYGRVVVAGAFYVSALLSLAAHYHPGRALELREVQFHTPLALDGEHERALLHLHVLAPAEDGSRRVAVASSRDGVWTTHASARFLGVEQPLWETAPVAPSELTFAPTGEPFLARMRAEHLDYGPRWRWLTGVAVAGDLTYGRLQPPDPSAARDAPLPAGLLDHSFIVPMAKLLLQEPEAASADDAPYLPFAIERLVCSADASGAAFAAAAWPKFMGDVVIGDVALFDARGRAVARLHGFTAHRAPKERLFTEPSPIRDLYRLDALPLELSGTPLASSLPCVRHRAELAALPLSPELAFELALDEEDADEAAALIEALLRELQLRLAHEPPLRRLTVCTRAALKLTDDDAAPRLDAAAVWGLLRSLRSERGDLDVRLLDSDDHPLSRAARERALALALPELALREGRALRLRLTPMAEQSEQTRGAPAGPHAAIDPERTVVITGASGAVAGALAEHLVGKHGVRHLLLLSRRGEQAEGAAALTARLYAAGARSVTLVGCDVSEREELARTLAAIPEERPLGAVFHTAAVLRDGAFHAQRSEHVREVFAPKLHGALLLDELTRDLGTLSHFVLFSSISGVLGGPGQANYAAANAALDALAARRRARGLPATSVAFGPWDELGMAAALSARDRARLASRGVSLLPVAHALALLDAALARSEPLVVAMRVAPEVATTPLATAPLFAPTFERAVQRSLAPRPESALLTKADSAPLSEQPLFTEIMGLAPAERRHTLERTLMDELADMLGGARPAALTADADLRDVGLDSLMGIELRQRLRDKTGLPLPQLSSFEPPSFESIAEWVLLRYALAAIAETPLDQLREAGLSERLLAFAAEPRAPASSAPRQSSIVRSERSTHAFLRVVRPAARPHARVVCFAGLGGRASAHVPLATRLPPELEVLAANLPGRDGGREPPAKDLARVADAVMLALEPRLDRPIVLYGHSAGTWQALEVAYRLERRAVPFALVVVAGVPAPSWPRHTPMDDFLAALARHAPLSELQRCADKILPSASLASEELLRDFGRVAFADAQMAGSYAASLGDAPQAPLSAPIVAVAPDDDPIIAAPSMEVWRALTTSSFRRCDVRGTHAVPVEAPELVAAQLVAAVHLAEAASEPARTRRASS